MPNGSILVGGGTYRNVINNQIEFVRDFALFNTQTGQVTQILADKLLLSPVVCASPSCNNRLDLVPPGSVFYAGTHTDTAIFKFDPPTWSANILSGIFRPQSSAVMYSLNPMIIMKCGGDQPGTNTTDIINLSSTNPRWRDHRVGNPNDKILMNFETRTHDLVIAPNGNVYKIGGNRSGTFNEPVMYVEEFDPETETWTTMAQMPNPRAYHSVSWLNVDATIGATGTEPTDEGASKTCDIFIPPILTEKRFCRIVL